MFLLFQGLTILCDSSSIRLVSSGMYENLVTVSVREAGEEDMNYEENVIMLCPDFDWTHCIFQSVDLTVLYIKNSCSSKIVLQYKNTRVFSSFSLSNHAFKKKKINKKKLLVELCKKDISPFVIAFSLNINQDIFAWSHLLQKFVMICSFFSKESLC